MLGICLLVADPPPLHHGSPRCSLAPLILTLVLPNYTTTVPGPTHHNPWLPPRAPPPPSPLPPPPLHLSPSRPSRPSLPNPLQGVAALRAARANRLQTSLNLALDSALASIGLTIPAVAIVSFATGWTLTLGIDVKSTVLLVLSLLVAAFSLSTGRTTVLHGVVHLVIFAVYLFLTIVP